MEICERETNRNKTLDGCTGGGAKDHLWGLFINYHLLEIPKVHILCVGDAVMSEPFRGQIRKEDVRAVEKDRVEMYRSFRC